MQDAISKTPGKIFNVKLIYQGRLLQDDHQNLNLLSKRSFMINLTLYLLDIKVNPYIHASVTEAEPTEEEVVE